MRLQLVLASSLVVLSACARPAQNDPPAGPATASVSPPSSSSSSNLGPSTSATSASASGCKLWGGRGFSLSYSDYVSSATILRKFQYDDASGVLDVDDSSPKSVTTKKRITLTPEQRDTLAGKLMALCPTDQESKRGNAPGGGSTLEVTTSARAKTTVEAWNGSGAVRSELSKLVPELR